MKRTSADIQIESRYERDSIVVMPVNRETCFVFWELSRESMNGRMQAIRSGRARLMVKVHDRGRKRQVCAFDVRERFGSHYIASVHAEGPLVAEIGLKDRRSFRRLLRSGPCTVAFGSDAGSKSATVKWMKKEGGAYHVTAGWSMERKLSDDEEFLDYLRRHSVSGPAGSPSK